MAEICSLRVEYGVGWVVIDHPPLHLVDGGFIGALVAVLERAESDDAIRVLVFESADPDFFLMHGDVQAIMAMTSSAELATKPNAAQTIFNRVQTFPKPTMAMINGQARGGGSEFLCSVDMRFSGPDTILGQPEVAMGILPGAGGTQRLPILVGRARALEIILGSGDVSATEAEAMGYVNRVLPAEELRPYVAALARRIAASPPEAVRAAKAAVDARLAAHEPQFVVENEALRSLTHAGYHLAPMQRFLDAGGQTRAGETFHMAQILDAMGEPTP